MSVLTMSPTANPVGGVGGRPQAARRVVVKPPAVETGNEGVMLLMQLRRLGKRIVVNLGGTGEVPDAINLNPNIVAPRKSIPNLIAKKGEQIGDVFDPGTVDEIVSNRLPPNTIDWTKVLPGAHKVLKPGGSISIRFQVSEATGRLSLSSFASSDSRTSTIQWIAARSLKL